MSKAWDSKHQADRMREKAKRGECYSCNKPAREGRKRCVSCAEKATRYAKSRRTQEQPGEEVAVAVRLPRCRCGLLLPCNNCVPTSRELAESRRCVE